MTSEGMQARYEALRNEVARLDVQIENLKTQREQARRERDYLRSRLSEHVEVNPSGADKFYVRSSDVRSYLEDWFRRTDETRTAVARRAQVSTRTIRGILSGRHEMTSLRVADQVLIAVGGEGVASTLEWFQTNGNKQGNQPFQRWKERQEELETLAGY